VHTLRYEKRLLHTLRYEKRLVHTQGGMLVVHTPREACWWYIHPGRLEKVIPTMGG